MMRVFPPLPADHPLVNTDEHRCAKCHQRFVAGERTTLIPVDPSGQGGTVEALPAHARCVMGMGEQSPST